MQLYSQLVLVKIVQLRAFILEGLEFMDIKLDEELNSIRGQDAFIHAADSSVKVMVIPTNEEVMIARDVAVYYSNSNGTCIIRFW